MPRLATLLSAFRPPDPPPAGLPLQGVTLLVVEDSRYTSDALRLMSLRCGARLSRAETLEAAWAHLKVYRPDVILVDLGLPDGRGEGLIRRLAASGPDRPAMLGMSGDPDGRVAALAAGADGWLDKPVAGLEAFQLAILALLRDRPGQLPLSGTVEADPLALQDDFALAARALAAGPDARQRLYLAGFLGGLARQTCDGDLGLAATCLRDDSGPVESLTRLLGDRLMQRAPFRQAPRGRPE
jgi:CheY-like chemotaxis protein